MSDPTSPSSSIRRHRSREERREVIAAWRTSGQTQSAFCSTLGLHPKSLRRWISEEEARGDGAPPPRAVGFVPAVPPQASTMVRWLLPGGLGEVRAATPADLAQVLHGVLRNLR